MAYKTVGGVVIVSQSVRVGIKERSIFNFGKVQRSQKACSKVCCPEPIDHSQKANDKTSIAVAIIYLEKI